MIKTGFYGGVYPPEYKELIKDKHIQKVGIPNKVVIPLSQHTGSLAKPVVTKGDYVKYGQKIGELTGKISSNIHSSISGRVIDICSWPHPVINQSVVSVVIESDGLDTKIEIKKTYADYFRYPVNELLNIIKESGIVGLGGAAFPTYVKLSPPKEIDIVILNGCECEPYLSCDDALMQEYPKEIVEGLKIIMYILDVSKGIIVIEDNKPESIGLLKKAIYNEPNIEIIVVKTKYPQGAEKQLIKSVLNREVLSGGLPFDVGVIVHNIGTSYAIYQAIKTGFPLVTRVVTISGQYIQQPGNYEIRIGTLVKDVLKETGYNPQGPHKLVFGGPMMGIAQTNLEVPVIKGTSGILVLPVEDTESEYFPCVRCCKCIDSCPMKLMPNMISIYSEKRAVAAV